MGNNTKPVVEGGLLVAIEIVLGLAATYLPIIGVVIDFFCAVPIVVLTVRQGSGKGLMALIVSFALLSMFIGPLLAARIALSFGICGLILGYCIEKNFGAVKSFLATLVTAFIAQIFSIAVLTFVMEINVMDTELQVVKESFAESFAMYEEIGVDKKSIDEAKAQVEPAITLLSFLMPTLLILMALVNTVASYKTSQWIFPKLRLKFLDPMPPFNQWKFPVIFLYITAFSIIGMYWGDTRNWNLLFTISLNSMFFSMSAGLIQGFSLLSYLADKHNVSKFFRRLFFVVVILNLILIQIVAFTGLFDMLFDYRKKFFGR